MPRGPVVINAPHTDCIITQLYFMGHVALHVQVYVPLRMLTDQSGQDKVSTYSNSSNNTRPRCCMVPFYLFGAFDLIFLSLFLFTLNDTGAFIARTNGWHCWLYSSFET